MQSTQSKTAKAAFDRAPKAGRRQFTARDTSLATAARWVGLTFLLLGASFIEARAQGISDPNQITGTIKWTNDPAGEVYAFLNSVSPPHGLAGGPLFASQLAGGFSAFTAVPDSPSRI